MNRALSLIVVLLSLAILPARAAITLHIDTTAQEFYFSGSDTGSTFGVTPTEYIIDWSNDAEIGGTIEFNYITASFSLNTGTLLDASFSQSTSGYSSIILRLSATEPESLTVTADDSIRHSYAGYDPYRINFLNALAASPQPYLANPGNTGFSDVDVVPEPGTIGLLALGLGGLLVHRLRRRAA